MTKEYTLKSNNVGIESIKSKIIHDLNMRIGARQDCKVTIGKIDARSGGQLKAYWCLVKAIQDWMIKEGNFYLGHGRNTFNIKDIDQLSNWVKIEAGFFTKERITVKLFEYSNFCTTNINKDFFNRDYPELTKKAKSIANNSDCTREDMKGIIEWILNFAADMVIPECKIKDTELENMLKHYDL